MVLVLPSHDDPVARDASTLVGGPVGRHARLGGSFWKPMQALLLLTVVTFSLGVLHKAACLAPTQAENYSYTRLCYSDVRALYFNERLHEDATPYLDHPVEYPVVIGALMYAVAAFVDSDVTFLLGTAALLGLAALVVTATTAATSGRRRWDAALVALAPGLLLHGLTNWDLAAVAFAGLGMWAWARREPALSGVFLGAGIATKLYPVLFFVPLLVLCLRARRFGAWAVALGAAAATWVAVNLPVYLAAGHFTALDGGTFMPDPGGDNAWLRFYSLNRSRVADWDSLWYAGQQVFDGFIQPEPLNLLVAGTFLLALVGIVLLICLAPRRPRVAQVYFLTLAAFLLTNKVNSPQYTLWLIPLAVLARPRWGAFLTWQLAEVFVMFTRFYYFVGLGASPPGSEGLEVGWFISAVLLRDAALVALMGLVVREILRPQHDVVRAGGVDDPAGGVLDRAPDGVDLSSAWQRTEPGVAW